eukprot:14787486-Alexandrium_andersonii.AAC.1
MSASLVGSEMCIRDRSRPPTGPSQQPPGPTRAPAPPNARWETQAHPLEVCLLYTSDAADDM